MLEISHKSYLMRIILPGRFRVRKQTSLCQMSSKKFWPNLSWDGGSKGCDSV
jgi:hypothetical protein